MAQAPNYRNGPKVRAGLEDEPNRYELRLDALPLSPPSSGWASQAPGRDARSRILRARGRRILEKRFSGRLEQRALKRRTKPYDLSKKPRVIARGLEIQSSCDVGIHGQVIENDAQTERQC